MRHALLTLLLGIACLGGCADMHAGRTFTNLDEFDNTSRSGVALGSIINFGDPFSAFNMTLSKLEKGSTFQGYQLAGEVKSEDIDLRFETSSVKVDQSEPITLPGVTGRGFVTVGRYGVSHYDPFAVAPTGAMLRQWAAAESIEFRFNGDRVYAGPCKLTKKQLEAVRLFVHVHVAGQPEETFAPGE